jgi:gliding motility-associated-like protein
VKISFYFLASLLLLSTANFSPAPPAVTGISTAFTFSPEELVRDYFIKGSCQNVANIESFGSEVGIGFFSNGGDVIGFDNGIIISTGNIKDAEGPNDDVATSTSFNNVTGDPDINLFATNVVLDATGIEFDFIPFGNQVTFKYVFASEEYCEFVGSIFNDNFGFFVSGPGIDGDFFNDAINVATLPNSSQYVTINNVNHESNAANYVKNELPEDTDNCGIPFGANHLEDIEFDGFTIPIRATIPVIPCETYHIRLVVADVGDDKLDSAIFLEAKSFDLGGEVEIIARSAGSEEPIAYEDCRDGAFVFKRTTSLDFNQPLTVNFSISPESQAVPGLDFEPLPSSITIPANQNMVSLPVIIIPDLIDEEPELLRLDVQYDCDCFPADQADLYISDLDSLQGTFEEIFVCPDQPFSIGPEVFGGAEPYEYIWNTGATTRLLTETVDEPTHFTVTITDDCGNETLAIAGVGIQEQPTAELSGMTQLCEGETAFLSVSFEGNPPWSVTYSIDEVDQPPIEGITTNPYTLPVTASGEYVLTNFTDAYCEGIPTGMGTVFSSGVTFDYSITPPSCPGAADGSIRLLIPDSFSDYRIEWNVAVNDSIQPSNLVAETYTVRITDANDCSSTATIILPSPTAFASDCAEQLAFVPNLFTPNGDGNNDWFTVHIVESGLVERIATVRIFNRWGGTVFEVRDLTPGPNLNIWNGSNNREPLDSGVYVWMMVLNLSNGEQRVLSGDVSLVR